MQLATEGVVAFKADHGLGCEQMEKGKSNPTMVSPHSSVRMPSTQTRSVLLLVSDIQIFQDFAEWVTTSTETKGESILHVSLNGAISLDSEELPGILEVLNIADVRDCDNEMEMTKRTHDALSGMGKYDKILFDPLSPFSEMYLEDSAPVHILKDLIPLLEHRGSLGYFCLTLDSHTDETIARCKDLADVCVQVTYQDESLLVQALHARGIYTKDFFRPRTYRNWPTIGERAGLPSEFHPTIKTAVGVD